MTRDDFPARTGWSTPGRTLPAVALAALCLGAPAQATDVYRWVDENGRVQFSQRPPAGAAERITLPGAAPAAPAGNADSTAQRLERQQRLLEAFEYERGQKAEKARDAAERAARRGQWCQALDQQRRFLAHGGPVYYRRDDGSRDYLSDERRADERRAADERYARFCR